METVLVLSVLPVLLLCSVVGVVGVAVGGVETRLLWISLFSVRFCGKSLVQQRAVLICNSERKFGVTNNAVAISSRRLWRAHMRRPSPCEAKRDSKPQRQTLKSFSDLLVSSLTDIRDRFRQKQTFSYFNIYRFYRYHAVTNIGKATLWEQTLKEHVIAHIDKSL